MTCARCSAPFEPQYRCQIYCNLRCQNSEHSRRKRFRNALYVNKDKANRGCARCEERRVPCLDYHHTDPASKTDGISELVKHGVALTRLKAEIAKCIILCANCHRVEEASK